MAKEPSLDDVFTRTLAPMQQADGTKTWRFVTRDTLSADETVLIDSIATELAKALWCPAGWDITTRTHAKGTLIIEGKCR